MRITQAREALLRGERLCDMPMRVAYYARVSTDKDEQLHSLAAQKAYYDEKIAANSNWSFAGGYIDEGRSATKIKGRESFLRMLRDAENGAFDFILTKEISRFSRNTLDSIGCTQRLLSYGVGVLFEADGINTLMPDAELRLAIMSSIAQDEVRKISERVRFGFRRAQERGVVLGNGNILGYRKAGGRLVEDEHEAEIVRRIFDLYANRRLGIGAICERLTSEGVFNSAGGEFSYSSVRGVLTNPKYKGFYCGGKSRKLDYRMNMREKIAPDDWLMYSAPESVPPLVSGELWERANAQLAERSGKYRHSTGNEVGESVYSGHVFCAFHDKSCRRASYKSRNVTREVWQCPEYSAHGRSGCTAPSIASDELDIIIDQLASVSEVDATRIAERLYARLKRFSANEDKRGDIRSKLLELYLGGYITKAEYENRLNKADAAGSCCEITSEMTVAACEPLLETENLRDRRIIALLLGRVRVSAGNIPGIIEFAVSTPYRGNYRGVICRKRGQTSSVSLQYI